MPHLLRFDQLVERFGEVIAWHCLAEIEKAASLQPQCLMTDPEIRLAHAIDIQDAMNISACHAPRE